METIKATANYVLETGETSYYHVMNGNINEIIEEFRKHYTNTHFLSIVREGDILIIYRARQWTHV